MINISLIVKRKDMKMLESKIRKIKFLLHQLQIILKLDIRVKIIYDLIEKINREKRPIVVAPYITDWDIPLFQRPQHIARNMVEKGYTYIFFTSNTYDDIDVVNEIYPNLYIVNKVYTNLFVKLINVDLKYIYTYSTDMKINIKKLERFQKLGFQVIYDYIDEIAEELYGSSIPLSAIKKHRYCIENRNIYICCTAKKLYEEVHQVRKTEKLSLVTNGVDYSHFATAQKKEMDKFKGKTIIGYYGALSQWVDFDLITYLAKVRPEYELILIGQEYDAALKLSSIRNYSNIHVLGVIGYDELPKYAKNFDVAIIPFKVNSITEATSPIKLFEYMALKIPIVTTKLRECMEYKSVNVASSYEEFVRLVDEVIKFKNNAQYMKQLKQDALENTWESKTQEIINLINDKVEKEDKKL